MARPARIEYEGAFYHVISKQRSWGQIFILDKWEIKTHGKAIEYTVPGSSIGHSERVRLDY